MEHGLVLFACENAESQPPCATCINSIKHSCSNLLTYSHSLSRYSSRQSVFSGESFFLVLAHSHLEAAADIALVEIALALNDCAGTHDAVL